MEWNEKCKKSKNNVHLTNWPTKKSYIAALLFGGLLLLLHIIQALSLESVGACASASASKYLNIDAYAFHLIEKGNVCLDISLVQMARPFFIFFVELKLSPIQIKPKLVSTIVNFIWAMC